MGNADAELVIVEYSDFECPYCSKFHKTMEQVMADYGKDGKVAWVYRHYPLDFHQNAMPTAVASECVARIGGDAKFFEFAKKHSDTLRRNGVEPMFLMTWAYADKPEMTHGLADAYTQAGRQNDAHVIPAGLAFAASVARRPDVDLYAPDKRHPSLAGTYLAAATLLASVWDVNPVGSKYTAGLPAGVARHLQEVAWETTRRYHGRP
jgi:hypothetical protein